MRDCVWRGASAEQRAASLVALSPAVAARSPTPTRKRKQNTRTRQPAPRGRGGPQPARAEQARTGAPPSGAPAAGEARCCAPRPQTPPQNPAACECDVMSITNPFNLTAMSSREAAVRCASRRASSAPRAASRSARLQMGLSCTPVTSQCMLGW